MMKWRYKKNKTIFSVGRGELILITTNSTMAMSQWPMTMMTATKAAKPDNLAMLAQY